MGMSGQIQMTETPDDDPELVVDLGNAADLTLGGPGPGKEDKRYEVS